MPRLTRFICPDCNRTVVVLSTNGQATLRVACEDDEREMKVDGYRENVRLADVPPLQLAAKGGVMVASPPPMASG